MEGHSAVVQFVTEDLLSLTGREDIILYNLQSLRICPHPDLYADCNQTLKICVISYVEHQHPADIRYCKYSDT